MRAAEQVRLNEPGSLPVWMAQQPFWKNYLERRYVRELEVPQRFYDQLAEDADAKSSERLQAQVNEWTEQTELQLTNEALRRWV